MFKRSTFLGVGIILIVISIGGFFIYSKISPAKAGILIQTTPQALVYVDGEQLGTTPYEAVRAAGEITVRLVPVVTDVSLAPWGTKLNLIEGVQTVIKRDFGATEISSSGEVLSFEKVSGNRPVATIVSSPDASQITFDGELKGYTPFPLDSVTPGQHSLVISYPGYSERKINIKTEAGYKLTVVAMLAQLPKEASSSEEEETNKQSLVKVKILTTPTGFLRVRSAPTSSATEEAQVSPKEEFTLLEEQAGWYKIEYNKDKTGWISSQYSEKVEQ